LSKFCASRTKPIIDGSKEIETLTVDAKEKAPKLVDRSVAEILADLNFCPFVKLAQLSRTARSEYIQAQAAAELAKYTRPQLKSVEHRGNKDEPVNLIFNI